MSTRLPLAAELLALLARHLPRLRPAAVPEHPGRSNETDLQLREFSNYPDLASWCLDRVPATESGHFAMGYGRAFVALIELMHADPQRRIRLLAISETDGTAERLRCVLACQAEESGSDGRLPLTTVLYEQGDNR